jgi:hypothetical protein
MAPFPIFHKVHGPGIKYGVPEPKTLKSGTKRFPVELVAEWESHGLCSFADGLLWTVDPNVYQDALDEWLPPRRGSKDKADSFVFARSAFGDLLVSRDGRVGQLNVHFGRYIDMGGNISIFLNCSLDTRYVKNALDGLLGAKAIKKLGALSESEMFTFEPALALGGAQELKYIKKVKVLPQLSILAQLFDEVTIE